MTKTYKLVARNFQSWRDFVLPMTGFTVIIGPSDRGKSAIIRALRGVLRNQIGANHITYGQKNTAVSITINGTPIELTRNAKTTTYTVGEEEYGKLAGEVPPVVKEMGFNEVEVNGVKLDPIFAGQFDSQFMLDLSPAELNSIFGLFSSTEKLNAGKKAAISKNLEFNATAKFLAAENLEAEAKKGLLDSLNQEIEEHSQEIFSLEDSFNSIVTSYNLLIKLIESRKQCASLRTAIGLTLPDTTSLTSILSAGKFLVQYSKKKKNLITIKSFATNQLPSCDDLSKQFQTVLQLIRARKTTNRVHTLQELPTDTIINTLSPILDSIKKLCSYITRLENINDLKSSLSSSNKQIADTTQELAKLKGNSIQCPECGHFFTGETHGHD